MITSALALAVERASKSSAEEQEVIAALIIDELESEKKWDFLLSNSKGKLAEMANRAISEHRAGKTYSIPDSRK
jgi:hypothetical protein